MKVKKFFQKMFRKGKASLTSICNATTASPPPPIMVVGARKVEELDAMVLEVRVGEEETKDKRLVRKVVNTGEEKGTIQALLDEEVEKSEQVEEIVLKKLEGIKTLQQMGYKIKQDVDQESTLQGSTIDLESTTAGDISMQDIHSKHTSEELNTARHLQQDEDHKEEAEYLRQIRRWEERTRGHLQDPEAQASSTEEACLTAHAFNPTASPAVRKTRSLGLYLLIASALQPSPSPSTIPFIRQLQRELDCPRPSAHDCFCAIHTLNHIRFFARELSHLEVRALERCCWFLELASLSQAGRMDSADVAAIKATYFPWLVASGSGRLSDGEFREVVAKYVAHPHRVFTAAKYNTLVNLQDVFDSARIRDLEAEPGATRGNPQPRGLEELVGGFQAQSSLTEHEFGRLPMWDEVCDEKEYDERYTKVGCGWWGVGEHRKVQAAEEMEMTGEWEREKARWLRETDENENCESFRSRNVWPQSAEPDWMAMVKRSMEREQQGKEQLENGC
ncbi:hypothetical protein EJ04DRAFT_553071 [Polyplosphaeria fusca]|uniref:Uncharacterized protein n=1 Tax=Polyplosphaeria fusca TaxID=682080 RepID=A0A9P4QZ69_9PLEO|nr:hypothetical protein EJ04DRAFT_553071 [Polyplosphaeria fusca]